MVPFLLQAQNCDPYFAAPHSARNANYDIKLTLDHEAKTIAATETLIWINHSPESVEEIRLYMYLNAFKNTNSTFLKGTNNVFGQTFDDRTADEWGWIAVNEAIVRGGDNLTTGMKYIQLDDGNKDDQTVLQIPLSQPIPAGDTLFLDMKFTAKMPKIIARTGYSEKDYFAFLHWFPQAGVYEQDTTGRWGWNCHQFFRTTEFYADFGNYDVEMTLSNHLKIGASGCKIKDEDNGDGTRTVKYHVEDVIDYAWVCYSEFEEHIDQWKHVEIKAMVPIEHRSLAPRLITAVKNSLEYLDKNVGKYPFTTITIIDPPLHGLRSGLMEYPTLITGGSAYGAPKGFRGVESLIVHEFAHQYFMMMLASNEKEEAWLDEGFVTYYEDRIGINYYGEQHSQMDLFGLHQGNRETSRVEYTSMDNLASGATVDQGWNNKTTRSRELVYQKTGTMLVTMERLLGLETMNKVIKTYFEKWKFKHPRGTDFIAVALEVVEKEKGTEMKAVIASILQQSIYEASYCDYAMTYAFSSRKATGMGLFEKGDSLDFQKSLDLEGYNNEVRVDRKGEMILPVDIEIIFKNGEKKIIEWDGVERSKVFEFESESKILSAQIDPEQNVYLDINFNNNSYTWKPEKFVFWKYVLKTIYWVQNVLQSIGMFS